MTTGTGDAIVVEGLVKRFGDFTAVDGVDLTVAEGTVLGLLGPNGAGKTTVVRILATLMQADGGRASISATDSPSCASARASVPPARPPPAGRVVLRVARREFMGTVA